MTSKSLSRSYPSSAMARRGAEDQTDPSKLAGVSRAKSRSFAAGGARQSRAATDERITGRGRTCRTGAWRSQTRTWCWVLCKGVSGDGVREMGWKSVASFGGLTSACHRARGTLFRSDTDEHIHTHTQRSRRGSSRSNPCDTEGEDLQGQRATSERGQARAGQEEWISRLTAPGATKRGCETSKLPQAMCACGTR